MCFGSKNDGDGTEHPPRPAQGQQPYASEPKANVPPQFHSQQQQYAPPPGPPPSHGSRAGSGPDYAPPPGLPPPGPRPATGDDFGPPPGPPPLHRPPPGDDFAPPPGPPPSQRPAAGDYAPPPGPPPSHGPPPGDYAPPPGPPPPSHRAHDDLSYIAPPPGPPPVDETRPRPQHDWESVVPDTSLFPPPPSFFSGWDRSPANNATEAEAQAGEHWCAQHPLTPPIALDPAAVAALHAHNPRLMQPDGFRGSLVCTAPGVWAARTDSRAADSTIIAYPPLYAVTLHSPLAPSNRSGGATTVYYEVQLAPRGPREICLALGFTALPYPSFRMPGWHRGSLAVHGDDGHRFVNDRWGGKSFTTPFAAGERLGIGMTFRVTSAAGSGGGGGGGAGAGGSGSGAIETEVFFTRQGREAGRWNLHEETDAEQDLPVTGLEGYHDLSCAIGTSGETAFEVLLDPARWMYRPAGY